MQLTLQFTLDLKGCLQRQVYRLNSGAALRQRILFLLRLALRPLDDLLSVELCMDLREVVYQALYWTCKVCGQFHRMILRDIVLWHPLMLDVD